MNISLPEPLKAFVDAEVAKGGYSSTSEYVRELLRAAQRRQLEQKLERLLTEGVESGKPQEMTRRDWDEIRKEGLARLRDRESMTPP